MVTMLKNKCSVWKRIKFPTFWYKGYYFTWSDTYSYFIQLETLLINHPSYIISKNERRKKYLPCEIRTGNCLERFRISTKTVGSMNRRFQRPPTTTKALLLIAVPAISIRVPPNQTYLDVNVISSSHWMTNTNQCTSHSTVH